MGLFTARRHASMMSEDAPLSRGLLLGMLGVIAVLGYLVLTDRVIPKSIIFLGLGFGVVALWLGTLVRPELPLYLLVAYLPFSQQLAGNFGGAMTALNLTNIFIVMIVWGWLTGTAASRRPLFTGHWLHVPVLLMAGWGILSYIVAGASYGGWYWSYHASDLKRWLDLVVLYFIFFHLVHDRQRWKNVVVIMMMSLVVVAAMAVWEYQTGGHSSSLDRERVKGIADNPNALGAFFVYYMFLFAGFLLERVGRVKRWWLLAPFLLCFRGIMVTFSRGAYLAFGAGCLGLAFARNKLLFLLTCGALWFAVLNPWVLPAGIRYRLESTFTDKNTQITEVYGIRDLEQEVDRSAAVRLIVWQGALGMIKDHPVFGVGIGEFASVIRRYTNLERWIDAHNAYLLTAAEMGVPTLVFFLLAVLMVCWMAYWLARRHSDPFIRSTALGIFGGISGLLIVNLFGSRVTSAEVSGYFWILAAMTARANLWVREEQRARRQTTAAAGGRRIVRTARPVRSIL